MRVEEGLVLFGKEGGAVSEERGIEGEEDLGVELGVEGGVRSCGRVNREGGLFTSSGSEFHEMPGQDWITSLHAFRIYSLMMINLNVGSIPSRWGIVRTILHVCNSTNQHPRTRVNRKYTYTKL